MSAESVRLDNASSRPVLRAIRQRARHNSDLPAVLGRHSLLTYGELWRRSCAWASSTTSAIHEDERVVGIFRHRDTEIPVCQLAAWLAGASYVPLDPALPDHRIAQILEEARISAVMTTDGLAARLPKYVTAVCGPDGRAYDIQISTRRSASAVAYVIYTSGSTGIPKGVEVSHESLAVLAWDYASRFTLGPGARVAMTANLGFDCLVFDTWCTLAAGACIVVPEPSDLDGSRQLVAFLNEMQVDHTFLGTGRVESILAESLRPIGVRSIITGGDVLRLWPTPDFPSALHNSYGPTEATVVVTVTNDLRTYTQEGLPPIGFSLPHAEVWLEDEDGHEITSSGTLGELTIGPTYLARGYLNRPDLTAAAFLEDGPLRRYKTGDICSRRPDGEFVFHGRRDRQRKVDGNRLELAEVEASALQCEGVRQVVSELIPDRREKLGMWFEGTALPAAIREHLAARLPAFMVPEAIECVSSIPRTPNGKLDREGLLRMLKSS